MDKKSKQRLLHQKEVFCSTRTTSQLCQLLRTDKRRLHLLANKPRYRTFTVPKKDGGERKIEDPYLDLKKVLNHLNRYLQAVYYFEKSRSAYGFIVGVRNDDDRRNVVTNAKKHVGRDYLLNLDLKNFFHAVTYEQVVQIFAQPPFNFKRNLPNLLADLTTYQGRLPMGAPTSPVLSNFACRELDRELTFFAEHLLWVYTRYADDMSFSATQPIHAEKINSVRTLIKAAGFAVNERKTKVFGKDDPKIVTGLLVTDEVNLAPDYLPTLQADIQRLHEVIRIQNEQGQLNTRWVEKYKQQVRGRLNFAGFVMGRRNNDYITLKDAFVVAANPPEDEFGAINWRGFPYNI